MVEQTPTITPEQFGAGGSKAFFNADSKQGDTITGTITAVETYQAKDFQTGEPQFSKSGKPKFDMRIDLADTNVPPADEFDDGSRSIYIHGWGEQYSAYKRALHAVSPTYKAPQVGDTMTATFKGLGAPFARGLAAPKLYEYKFEKGSTITGADNPFAQTQPSADGMFSHTQQASMPAAPNVPQQPKQPAFMPPAQQAQQAQPQQVGIPADKVAQIKQLNALGVKVEQIAQVTALSQQAVLSILQDDEPEF